MTGYTPHEATIHTLPTSLAQVTGALSKTGRRIALVVARHAPLHEGHKELLRSAGSLPHTVTVLTLLPPTHGHNSSWGGEVLDSVRQAAQECGTELVFAPDYKDMHPHGRRTIVTTKEFTDAPISGESHVEDHDLLTDYLALTHLTRATDILVGEKTYRLLHLVQHMVTDVRLPVTVHAVPVIRDRDGIPFSTGTQALDETHREKIVALSAALTAAAHVSDNGPAAVEAMARRILDGVHGLDVKQCALTDAGLAPLPPEDQWHGEIVARLFLVAQVTSGEIVTDNAGIVFGLTEEDRDREIAQAALSAAGLEGELTDAEFEQIRALRNVIRTRGSAAAQS